MKSERGEEGLGRVRLAPQNKWIRAAVVTMVVWAGVRNIAALTEHTLSSGLRDQGTVDNRQAAVLRSLVAPPKG